MRFFRSTIAGIAASVLGWKKPVPPRCPICRTRTTAIGSDGKFECENGHVLGGDAPKNEDARDMNAGDHHGDL